MKKIFALFLLFYSFSFLLLAEGYQSKEERINAINQEIETLMLKKSNLELLKKKIQESDSEGIVSGNFNESRPTIALVLSGGGAKGAAHVGVLKVLEEYKIPIDIVVGTSVGSIVGGMYSAGYSPEEIEKTILNLDFISLLTNSKDRNLKTIEEKLLTDQYPFKLSIDKEMNLSLPMGFLNGEKIYLQLKSIFNRAETVANFDELPRRYRAITTDINTGRQEIIKDGDLALATFKSMAIPSFLEPVRDKNTFYVDGGVTNNFPIDVALSMGADIIIAVDISANESKIDQNSSVVTILDKISSYNGNKNTKFQKQLADILIVPDVKEHNTIDFSNLETMIVEGEKSARKYSYLFKNLEFPQDYQAIQNKKLVAKPIKIKDVQLEGNEVLKLERVKKLMPSPKNNLFSDEDLNLWAKKIYAIPYIERVFYNVENDKITFTVTEKEGININAALNYVSNYGGSINLAATIPNFGSWTRNYAIMAEASEYPKITLNRISYYEWNSIKFLNAITFGYENNPFFIYRDGKERSTFESNTFKGELYFGTSLANNLISGLTLGIETSDIDYKSGNKLYQDFNHNYQFAIAKAFLYFDTLNSSHFASEGTSLFLEAFSGNRIEDDGEYRGYKSSFSTHTPLTKKLSFSLGGFAGKISGENIPNAKLFKVGGLRSNSTYTAFVGLPLMGRYVDEYYSGFIGIQYNLTSSLYLIGKYNTLTYSSPELSFQSSQKIGDNWEHGYGVGIGWDTFLGPMSFMISNDLDSSSPLAELYLGYIF